MYVLVLLSDNILVNLNTEVFSDVSSYQASGCLKHDNLFWIYKWIAHGCTWWLY